MDDWTCAASYTEAGKHIRYSLGETIVRPFKKLKTSSELCALCLNTHVLSQLLKILISHIRCPFVKFAHCKQNTHARFGEEFGCQVWIGNTFLLDVSFLSA